MQTQLTCPACQSPFVGEVHQIVDVGLHPEMKQMLLTGNLNVAQCPACGTTTRVSTPFLYHDPEHEHFLVYVPMEMGVGQSDQETIIGQLVRQAMDQLPAEERRGAATGSALRSRARSRGRSALGSADARRAFATSPVRSGSFRRRPLASPGSTSRRRR